MFEIEQCMIFYNIMNIEFQCDCGESLTALGHQVGELIDCPTCSNLVKVPPRPGTGILQKAEQEDVALAAIEHRGKPRISRAPTCRRCKTRLAPMAVKESHALGNILGRSIFAVGVVMSLLHDAAVVHHQDPVAGRRCRQLVADHHDRAPILGTD